jgi:uncharacterized phiE125 gp8 family phage protein
VDSPWNGALVLSSGPAVEPVTAAEAAAHLRIHSADNTEASLLSAWITSARQLVERATGRALIHQTWVKSLDAWPCNGEILLPWGRVSSVSGLTYVDVAGATRTIGSTNYQVDKSSDIGRIWPASSYSWPGTDGSILPISVTWVAGYGSAASAVPQALRDAIKFLVADWYDQRSNPGDMSAGVRNLILAYAIGYHG